MTIHYEKLHAKNYTYIFTGSFRETSTGKRMLAQRGGTVETDTDRI